MQVFNAKVRLQGSVMHEVARRGLTVPEIYVLRRIHGNDGVVDVVHVGDTEVDGADERERLDFEYAAGLANLHEDQKTSIEKMFGDYSDLPEVLRGYEGALSKRKAALVEYQASEPFESPNAEDKGAQIRRKAEAKKLATKDASKNIPAVHSGKKNSLDAVL